VIDEYDGVCSSILLVSNTATANAQSDGYGLVAALGHLKSCSGLRAGKSHSPVLDWTDEVPHPICCSAIDDEDECGTSLQPRAAFLKWVAPVACLPRI
jgi:hypothetical protein